jgi:hypothetical protein
VFLTPIATTKDADGDAGLFDAARDFATNTLETLRDSLDSPIELTKQAVTQVNEQIGTPPAPPYSPRPDAVTVDALDRGVEATGSSNIWQSLSKVKGKLFGGGGGTGPSKHA